MAEYFVASLGAFLIIFFELLSTYSYYTPQAIFNAWGTFFLAINILAGAGVYFVFDVGILQASLVESQGLNIFLIAFTIGTSFQIVIRSKLTFLRFRQPDSIDKVDLSTPWDEWYEAFRDLFYEKIDERVRKYVVKDVDQKNLRTSQLKDSCSVSELKNHIETFIIHCRSPRIKQKVEEVYSSTIEVSNNQKDEAWLHLRLAAIVQEYISDDRFRELTERFRKS